MYNEANMVHADLSEFNILIYKNKPYLIDLGQGVLLKHPRAFDFLRRDIHNILNHFNKYGIDEDELKLYNKIIKKNV
jgi:RIO kinase 1